jgi:transcriptional regulator of acetoin/glycerol metabolism
VTAYAGAGAIRSEFALRELGQRAVGFLQDTLGDYLAGHERAYIVRALESQDWQIQETANLLGISRKNLWEKMKRLEIRRNGE